jgi:hypothetical protein
MAGEPQPAIWAELLTGLQQLLDLAGPVAATEPLRQQARELLRPQLPRLGWDEHASYTPELRALRTRLIEALGSTGPGQLQPSLAAAVVGRHAYAPRFAHLLALAGGHRARAWHFALAHRERLLAQLPDAQRAGGLMSVLSDAIDARWQAAGAEIQGRPLLEQQRWRSGTLLCTPAQTAGQRLVRACGSELAA